MPVLKTIIFGLIVFFSMAVVADSPGSGQGQTDKAVQLDFFWSHRCPHCLAARPFVDALAAKYAWLRVNRYDLIGNPANIRRYRVMADSLGRSASAVPAFIFCDQMLVGFDQPSGLGRLLEQKLVACHQGRENRSEATELQLPILGKVDYRKFSLPALTLVIAALDAFNPCAFFVLLFLLSLLTHTRSRTRITVIGMIFVMFSGIVYFVFMAAWLNLFLLTGPLVAITAVAGVIAVMLGVINVKDCFYFRQGPSLSLSETTKPKLYRRMRNLVLAGQWPAMMAAAVILAIVANSYELLCTVGLPMIYTRILTLQSLSQAHYYAYLAFYNLIYVTPLFLIVVAYTRTLGGKKLTERQGRGLKLLSGLMMLGLGGMLLLAPELLNNMLASLSIVTVAVVLTGFWYFSERMGGKLD